MSDPTTLPINWKFRLIPFRSSLTKELSFDFFSSPYLDISVQEVPRSDKSELLRFTSEWVSPFGHRRIKSSYHFPDDFRRFETSFFGSCYLGIH